MVTPELVEGIRKHIQSGDSEEQIKHHVLEAGYSTEVFYEALRQARLQTTSPAPETTSASHVQQQSNSGSMPSGQVQPSVAVGDIEEELRPVGGAAAASVSQPAAENEHTPPPASSGNGIPSEARAVPNRSAWELVIDSIKATFKHPSLLVWFLLVSALAWAIMMDGSAAVSSLVRGNFGPLGSVMVFGVSLVGMLISILAVLAVLFSVVHNQGASFWKGMQLSLPYVWKFIWLSIMSSFIIMISAAVFVIPAVIVLGYIMLAQIVLAKEGVGGTTALARSTQLVYGKWWASIGRLALLVLVGMVLGFVFGLVSALFGEIAIELTSVMLQSFMTIVAMYAMYYWYQERIAAVPESAPATRTIKRYKILAWLGVVLFPVLFVGSAFLLMNEFNQAEERMKREFEMGQEEMNRILESEGVNTMEGEDNTDLDVSGDKVEDTTTQSTKAEESTESSNGTVDQSGGQSAVTYPSAADTSDKETTTATSDADNLPPYSINLLTPSGGDALCLGDTIPIRWESRDIKNLSVSIYQDTGFAPDVYSIGSYPATYNESQIPGRGEIFWEVGEVINGGTLKAGSGYRVLIRDEDSSSAIDRTDMILIQECQG